MTKQTITRTCSACGIEKPLSAFLEISSQGTRYGSICASCRSAGKSTPQPKSSDDETVTMPSGARLGSKERVHIEKGQKRQIKDLKDLFKKETQRKDALSEKQIDDTDTKEKERKEHRRYIEGKKQGFLTKTPSNAKTDADRAAISRTPEQQAIETKQREETVRQEDIIRQEFQINSLDLNTPGIDSTLAKYKTDAFKQFAALFPNAPIVKTLHLLYGTKQQTGAKPPTFLQEKKLEHKIDNKDTKELKGKETIENYVEKRGWNTSRSR